MRKRFKVYAEGGEIADYQIKKDGKYLSAGMDGNAKWYESPDKGYTYTKADAESFAQQLGLSNYEIVKYDKNWWKMAKGGEVKQFEVGDDVTFLRDLFVNQESDEYDSESVVREGRTLKIIKVDESNKVYYLKEQGYYKYIIGFKKLDGWLKEKYVKINDGYMADGGEIEKISESDKYIFEINFLKALDRKVRIGDTTINDLKKALSNREKFIGKVPKIRQYEKDGNYVETYGESTYYYYDDAENKIMLKYNFEVKVNDSVFGGRYIPFDTREDAFNFGMKIIKANTADGGYMADGGEINWGEDLGDGFSVGADVYITDSKSMFKGRTGFISGLAGKDLLVTISEDGNDRNVVVSKKGVEMLDAPEYAEGGMLDYTLTRIESDLKSFRPDGQSSRDVSVDKDSNRVTAEFRNLGNWINDEEDRYDDDFDESDFEDNDQQIWDDGEYTKYLNKFKAWASPFSWYVNTRLDLQTSEKNYCEFIIEIAATPSDKWILSKYKTTASDKPEEQFEYLNEEKAIKDIFRRSEEEKGFEKWTLGKLDSKGKTVSVFMKIIIGEGVFISDDKREYVYSLMPNKYSKVNIEEIKEAIETLEMLEYLDNESKELLKNLKDKLTRNQVRQEKNINKEYSHGGTIINMTDEEMIENLKELGYEYDTDEDYFYKANDLGWREQDGVWFTYEEDVYDYDDTYSEGGKLG